MNANTAPNRILPIMAIAIGAFLVLGGLAFVVGSSFVDEPNLPLAFTIAPAIQIATGLAAALCGLLLLKGIRHAKWILFLAIGVLFANWIYLITAAVPFIKASAAS